MIVEVRLGCISIGYTIFFLGFIFTVCDDIFYVLTPNIDPTTSGDH